MHVETKTLSKPILDALASVRYGARDIEVVASSTVSLNSEAAWKGARGFVIAINLETGERINRQGSWGGSNMFVRNAVDETDEIYTLPTFGVVITGQTGHPRTLARVHVHPEQLSRFLPAVAEETTDEEQQALYCYTGIKGGEYRREELRRRKVKQSTIDDLVERGYLSRNKAGSVQVTTKGKNARSRDRVRY